MGIKLFDSERKVMEVLWEAGPLPAKDLAARLSAQVGWGKTTAYTVIKKCVDKGAAAREDPGFLCRPLVTREMVAEQETNELIDKNYGGSADRLVASLLGSKRLSAEEVSRLKKLIEEWE